MRVRVKRMTEKHLAHNEAHNDWCRYYQNSICFDKYYKKMRDIAKLKDSNHVCAYLYNNMQKEKEEFKKIVEKSKHKLIDNVCVYFQEL
jgi:hypothetical protein